MKIKLRVGEGSDRLLLMPYKSKELVFLLCRFKKKKVTHANKECYNMSRKLG